MRKLLAAALAAILFPVVAMAGESGVNLYPNNAGYGSVWGDEANLSSTATNQAMNWGFMSSAVEVCVNPSLDRNVYWRMGTTISDSPGAARASQDAARNTVVATTNAIFQNGNPTASAGIVAGSAPVIRSVSSTPDFETECRVYPIRANGIIVHASGDASVWVTSFGAGRVE